MVRKKNAHTPAKKGPNTTLQRNFQKKIVHKFKIKTHLTLPYKNYAKKKKMHKFQPNKHLTLPYKNYAKKKKMQKFQPKKHLTLPQKETTPRNKNPTNSSQKSI